MTFIDKVLKDGAPTEAGVQAVKLLLEYFFCKTCPFRNEPNKNKGCMNCSDAPIDLLTSLDAWRPLWKMMDEANQLEGHVELLRGTFSCIPILRASPGDHLKAALRTLEVECPECGGNIPGICKDGIPIIRRHPTRPCGNDDICENECIHKCTCTDGKRTLYEIWEVE